MKKTQANICHQILYKEVIMKLAKGRIWIISIVTSMLILLGWMLWQNIRVYERLETHKRYTTLIEGVYSLDGGEWQPIDNTKPINEHFQKAVFKGKPIKSLKSGKLMNIVSKNAWYTIYDSNGEILDSYDRRNDEVPKETQYVGEYLTNTPGYYIMFEYLQLEQEFQNDEEITLEVEYPYEVKTESFSDCFYILLSYTDGIYENFFFDMLPSIIVFLLVCFFGVFFFPIASGLLGKINFQYLAFGSLCFFTGLFMLVDRISEYMNLWILDPTVCMMTDKLVACLFVLAISAYFRSLLNGKVSKIIASSIITLYFIVTIICVIFHMTDIADMMATTRIRAFIMIICVIAMVVLLAIEIRGKKGFELFDYLFSWAPLILFLITDFVDIYIHVAGSLYLKIGLAITIIYQIIHFALDYRQQYKEAIHYQQVQRELYEAKVNVMVSQIRPHFMYNALSSIAILCKLDPDTAYDATVTFSDYLRGNMDSLKQTAPVPFGQELEHLKKYLYIEKMRFDDKLNIEYDIQDTDFELPLLSIQPLVENAVKHGVGMKDDGGTVKIISRKTDVGHEVIIEDDGVGFDVGEVKNDARSHIGMENTKKRLHDMCDGEVIIESEIGKGTIARVIIPDKE